MKFYLLILVIVMSLIPIQAQNFDLKWNEIEQLEAQSLPKSALEIVNQIYQEALDTKNSPELIKSIIFQLKYEITIDSSQSFERILEIEKLAETNGNKVEQALLYSFLAGLYRNFHVANSYYINQRTAIAGYVPSDINEWSGNIFIQKITDFINLSLLPEKELQNTNILDYKAILIEGNASRNIRPTLYDFLVHNGINILDELIRNYQIQDYFLQTKIFNKDYFLPAEKFIGLKIDADTYDLAPQILKLYQQLLAFHLKEKNEVALMMIDFERLDFVRDNSQSEETEIDYLNALIHMKKQYAKVDFCAEILCKEANYYFQKANRDRKNYSEQAKKAYDICLEGIEKYPNYERIAILKNLLNEIVEKTLSVQTENVVYPGEELNLEIKYKNLDKLTVEIYKIDAPVSIYRQDWERKGQYKNKGTLIHKQDVNLINEFPYLNSDTTIRIPMKELGNYEFVISRNISDEELLNHQFSVSRLATVSRGVDNTREFLVVDRNSGKPIEGANINFYKKTRNGFWRYLDKYVTTNSLGLALGDGDSDVVAYNASFGNDSALVTSGVPWVPTYRSTPNIRQVLNLFTDRSIYRPGQTVFFKGIAYNPNKDIQEVIPNRQYTITLRDANYKEVATKTFTTNEFGSFSGEFLIPQGVMNGRFSMQSDQDGGRISFRVEEYKRPTFDILFRENDKAYRFGDKVVIQGDAKTFSGINLQDVDVQYRITRRSDWFSRIWRSPVQVAEGSVKTKEDGSFEISFVPEKSFQDKDLQNISYAYQIETIVTDTNGETQSRQTQIRIGDLSVYLVTEKLEELVDKEHLSPITINAFNLSGVSIPLNGKWEIYSLNAADKNQFDLNPEDWEQNKLITSGSFSSKQELTLDKLKSLASGRYRFVAKANDSEGREVQTQQDFTLYSLKDKRPPVRVYEWMKPVKTECLVGEKAEIFYGSSAKGVFVLYEIFKDEKKLSATRFVLNDEIRKIEIPYLDSYGDVISVCFTFVKDKKVFIKDIPIVQKQPDKTLTLYADVFRDKLLPGQKEEWKISIKDADKKNVSAELLAAMYDASLDKILPHSWTFSPIRQINIWNPYNQRGNEFNTSNNSLNYLERGLDVPFFSFDSFNWFGADTYHNTQLEVRSTAKSEIFSSYENSTDYAFLTNHSVRLEAKDETSGGGDVQQEVQIRQNFSETAFFYPQLKTNESGETLIAFTVPESNTSWKFMGLAHTKDLKYGRILKQAVSQKKLMITPNIPRFIREGDQMSVMSNISNLSDEAILGTVIIECFDPNTNKTNIIIPNAQKEFAIEAGKTTSVTWTFDVPSGIEMTALKIVAKSSTFSDGEQHLIPVLPNRMMVTESLPLNVSGGETRTFMFDKLTNHNSSSLENYRLTLEFASNPIWYAIQTLPSVTAPQTDNVLSWFAAYYSNSFATHIAKSTPKIKQIIDSWVKQGGSKETLLSNLEKNQELKTVLLEETPWVLEAKNESEQKQQLALLFDLNRAANLNTQALDKLKSFRRADGGWSWFKGMSSSVSITQWILYGLGEMAQQNLISLDDREQLEFHAIDFIDREIKRHYDELKKNNPNWEKTQNISTYPLEYLFVRSFYKGIPLGKAEEAAHFYTNLVEQYWAKNTNLYERAIAAIIMQRKGNTKVAQAIIKSLREHATNKKDLGMYWANNNTSSFMTQSATSIHTFIMEAFYEVGASEKEMDEMKLWLLKQKQTQLWESVPATVNSINILLKTGTNWLESEGKVNIQLGNKTINTNQKELGTGYLKEVVEAPSITADMNKITVSKEDAGPAWGAIYWQYFENLDKITSAKTELNVEKMLFVEKTTSTGKSLVPVTENNPLKIGDKVTVRLTVRTERDLEFVHLKDMRASCFELVNQLSGTQWKQGLMYYQSPTDVSMNFFFSAMPKGTYVFEYNLYVRTAGNYSNGITMVQCLYAPEYVSHTSGERVIVN